VKLNTLICGVPGLPLSIGGISPTAEWRADEQLTAIRARGAAIVAPKQTTQQGTSLHMAVRPLNVDFPYIHVRARAQDLA
jgi:hypothetical protein